ncbi:MAG: hypothetical protein ACKPKO_52430, partial [Candidatus Fonsibacter sp.]
YPDPREVVLAYGPVLDYVNLRGLGGCPSRFPVDLQDALLAAAGEPTPSATPPVGGNPLSAAERGRLNQ